MRKTIGKWLLLAGLITLAACGKENADPDFEERDKTKQGHGSSKE